MGHGKTGERASCRKKAGQAGLGARGIHKDFIWEWYQKRRFWIDSLRSLRSVSWHCWSWRELKLGNLLLCRGLKFVVAPDAVTFVGRGCSTRSALMGTLNSEDEKRAF
jgi:hypothetical protein